MVAFDISQKSTYFIQVILIWTRSVGKNEEKKIHPQPNLNCFRIINIHTHVDFVITFNEQINLKLKRNETYYSFEISIFGI